MLNDPGYPSARPDDNASVMAGVTACICAAWILPGLIGHDPWKPDEAYTFGLVYHILQGGGWVVPMLAGEPHLDNPPLFTLTAALLAKLLSFALPAHDGARLASGVFVALALAFTAAAGRALHGPGRGWVAALVLVGSLGLAVRAHQLIPDTALFAAFAMACYGLARMLRRALSGGFWLGTGAGLGFMAKGLLAPGVLAITAVALFASCREWRTRAAVAGAGAGLLAALPWLAAWPIALYLEAPALLAEWVRGTGVWRILRAEQVFSLEPTLHYLSILPWYAWPSLPLALWVLWGTRVSRFARPAIQLPAVLFLATFAALALSADARELYAMPLLIPLALLATPAVDSLRRGASNALYWFSVMGFSFFAIVFWIYWSGLELGIPQRLSAHLHRLLPAYDSHIRWLALLVGAGYTLAWVVVLLRLRRSPERPVIVWSAGITMLWGMAMSLFIAYLDAGKSYRSVSAAIARELPPHYDCISSRKLGESQRAMLHYFDGIVTYREEVPHRSRSCELLLVQGERSDPPEIPHGWHQIWEGTRPGEKREYFWLYGYGPPPMLN